MKPTDSISILCETFIRLHGVIYQKINHLICLRENSKIAVILVGK